MKKTIIIIWFFLLIYLLDSSYSFYNNYLSCKWLSDYKCMEKWFNQHWTKIKVEVHKNSNTDRKNYTVICPIGWDYCVWIESAISWTRKHSIEEKWIKKLFIESFF